MLHLHRLYLLCNTLQLLILLQEHRVLPTLLAKAVHLLLQQHKPTASAIACCKPLNQLTLVSR